MGRRGERRNAGVWPSGLWLWLGRRYSARGVRGGRSCSPTGRRPPHLRYLLCVDLCCVALTVTPIACEAGRVVLPGFVAYRVHEDLAQ